VEFPEDTIDPVRSVSLVATKGHRPWNGFAVDDLFHEFQPTSSHAEAALAQGVRGSAMPRWTGKLPPGEQKLLARYVRSFHDQMVKD
jgi:hypothetical protein